jgi:hypothetical protein
MVAKCYFRVTRGNHRDKECSRDGRPSGRPRFVAATTVGVTDVRRILVRFQRSNKLNWVHLPLRPDEPWNVAR